MNATKRDPSASTVVIDGEDVTIPVEVRSASMFGAQFVVDADAAQAAIAYSSLRIARQLGNRAVVSVNAVQYLDNDLGPYNEIAVAFVVEPHDAAPGAKTSMTKPTTLIHRLPVNQTFTCAAGKGIWGFPKWVASITLTDDRHASHAVLADGGEFVLSLDVARSHVPLPSQEMQMACYSWCDGVLRRTPWTTRTSRVTARIGGATIQLGTAHPMATELRSLGLPKTALMSLTTAMMTATFGLPEIIT